ncbi:MAG: hypothetical protein ACXWO3_11245 [Isosphaeraceae bacterium]
MPRKSAISPSFQGKNRQEICYSRNIKSTEIYARANLDMKRRALDKASTKSPTPAIPSWQKDKGLLDWLTSL